MVYPESGCDIALIADRKTGGLTSSAHAKTFTLSPLELLCCTVIIILLLLLDEKDITGAVAGAPSHTDLI